MPRARFATHYAWRWLALILSTSVLEAQTCLVLSPAPSATEGTASFELALYTVAGTRPSAVQWTLQYPSATVKKLSVEDGSALKSTGKTALCAGDATAYKCLTVGTAEKAIDDGIVARVTAVLASGATTATIEIKDALGTSPSSHVIPISAKVKSFGAGGPADCARPKPQGEPHK